MKKAISLVLAMVMLLCLCACGAGKITESAIREAMADCDGKLTVEGPADDVTGFTYVLEGVNAEDLVDKNYCQEAIAAILSGDTSVITIGHIKVSKAISALMAVDLLLSGEDEGSFDSSAYVNTLLGIICDGKSQNYGNWTVSVTVNKEADSITIKVAS